MLSFRVNELEKRRLLSYATSSMHDQLHWGDGEIIIPEEQILQEKIINAEDKLTLDFMELKLLITWFLDATDEGVLLLGEDISILNKLIRLLKLYHNALKKNYDVTVRRLKAQMDGAEKVLTELMKIVPKKEWQDDVTETQIESGFNKNGERITKNRKKLKNESYEERVDRQPVEVEDQRITLEERQKEEKFEAKAKMAKKLREELQEAKELTKRAKRKAKGKRLF
jgi:hypothetical protein